MTEEPFDELPEYDAGPTDSPGEGVGDGIILSTDFENGYVRVKIWGEWRELSPDEARGLAGHLHEIGWVPATYDVHGEPLGDAVDRLNAYATAVEAVRRELYDDE